ncbi:MAG: hypothetical protein IJY36_07715 [Coprobacter sp.]|nr:hypothetical protein [Coprobacter sp.]
MIIVVFLCAACCDETIEGVSQKPPEANRTVLVYMVASNTLSSYTETNISGITEAVKAGALNNGNMLLYIDKYNSLPTLEKLSLENGTVSRKVVKEYTDERSASKEAMLEVLTDVKQLYPSDGYGLILWSHASGWYPSSSSYNTTHQVRSFGDDEGVAMNITDIAEAIPDSMFDFILCDACYMGAVEVAYEWRAKSRYLISSSTAIMGEGFPYSEIVKPMFDMENSLSENLIAVCESYMDYYKNSTEPFSAISLTDLTEMESVARAMKNIVATPDTVTIADIQQFSQEQSSSVSFKNLFFDLDHYASNVATDPRFYRAFSEALSRAVIYAASTDYYLSNVRGLWRMYPIETFCGLSAYIPGADHTEKINNFYPTLSWYKDVYSIEIPLK